MKKLFYIFLLVLFTSPIHSQEKSFIIKGKNIEQDTMPHINLDAVYVFPKIYKNNWWNKWKYKRLIKNIKVVYPYAKYVRYKFAEMDNYYKSLETEKEKRQYINSLEKEILSEFEGELKNLTISQGRLLIKLIDRETGHTSYEILKDYKGSVSAFFWQTLARLFGSDLKSGYDPWGDDRIIEELIFLYEMGLL